jgi:hypothetical protein
MKRYLYPIGIILFFGLNTACQRSANSEEQTVSTVDHSGDKEPNTPVVESFQTTQPIIIDGDLSEPAWQLAKVISLKNNVTGDPISDKSYFSYAKTCYDSNNLYIAFVNGDKNIFTGYTQKDQFLWQDEVVEVFIDGDPDISTYIELEVSPANVVFDSYITDTLDIDLVETPKFEIEGFQTAVKVNGTVNDSTDIDQDWTVEILIPLQVITEKRTDGKRDLDQYRINFYRINRDSQGPGFYAWSPTYQRFHAPSKFGTILLK